MFVIARRDRLSQNADDLAAALGPVVKALKAEGCTTLGVLADVLDALGKTTRRGGRWLVSNSASCCGGCHSGQRTSVAS